MIRPVPMLLALPLLLAACQSTKPVGMADPVQPAKPTKTVALSRDGGASSRTGPETALGWVDRADAAGLRYGDAPFLVPRQVAGLDVSGRRQSPGRDIDGLVQYGIPSQGTWATFFVYKASAFDADLTVMTSTQAAAIMSAPGRRLVADTAMPLPGGDGTPVVRQLLWQEEVGRASTLVALSGGGWVVKLRVSGPDRAAVEQVTQAALAGLRVDPGTKPSPVLADAARPKACTSAQQGPEASNVALDIGSTIIEGTMLGSGELISTWPPDQEGDTCIEVEGREERRPFILLRRQDAAGKATGWLAPLGDAGIALECAPGLAGGLGLENVQARYVMRLHAPGRGEIVAGFDALPNREQILKIIRQMLGPPIPPSPEA
ncbi:hypothetical protein [Niveispirillum fermenti]|uniref:hypothetical protein n=1 Tax=Niveispirillum fermenti TaxID=1233113 RepID=UPI003A84B5C4